MDVVKKWDATGLLLGLDAQKKVKMATLLERQAQYIIANKELIGDSKDILVNGHIMPDLNAPMVTLMLPVVRRTFASIDYRITDAALLPCDLGVTLNDVVMRDVLGRSIDVDAAYCLNISNECIEAIKKMGKPIVGSVPLEIRRTPDGLVHFMTRALFISNGLP